MIPSFDLEIRPFSLDAGLFRVSFVNEFPTETENSRNLTAPPNYCSVVTRC